MAFDLHLPQTGIALVDRALEFISRAFEVLDAQPLLDTVLLAPQLIGTTDTKVYHGLGRLPRGQFVVAATADVRVWQSAAATSEYLTLRASSAQTVTLAVF